MHHGGGSKLKLPGFAFLPPYVWPIVEQHFRAHDLCLKFIVRLSFAHANQTFWIRKQCNKLSSGAHQRSGLLGVNATLVNTLVYLEKYVKQFSQLPLLPPEQFWYHSSPYPGSSSSSPAQRWPSLPDWSAPSGRISPLEFKHTRSVNQRQY